MTTPKPKTKDAFLNDEDDLIDGTTYSVSIGEDKAKARLDKALAEALPDLSRSRIKALILDGAVVQAPTGAALTDPALKVGPGFSMAVTVPEPEPALPEPEDIPLEVLFEDDHLIVINKPAGMVVHPAAGNQSGTLVNALLHHCRGSLSGIGGVARPGIVHRLDKETSGVMVAAKSDLAHRGLAQQFKDHSLSRSYKALVWGVPEPREGEIESQIGRSPKNRKAMAVVPVGGKYALTRYRVLRPIGLTASLVDCRLATGRTHQIRVHMTHLGFPIMGDPVYGGQRRRTKRLGADAAKAVSAMKRQALHADSMAFHHPESQELLTFSSVIPNDINKLIDILQ